MKIKRQYSFNNGTKERVARRQIEIEEGERIGIRVINRRANPVKDEEIIAFFMPGTLTLEWKQGSKIDK